MRTAVASLAQLFDAATLTVVEGSSGVSANKFFEQYDASKKQLAASDDLPPPERLRCDLIHVDGGRFGGVPLKDLRELHYRARENATVIMDDVVCGNTNKHVCAEPGRAWCDRAVCLTRPTLTPAARACRQRMKMEAKIAEVQCYEKEQEAVHFCVGRMINVPG